MPSVQKVVLVKAPLIAVAVVAVGLAHTPVAHAVNSATAARFSAVVNEMTVKYRLAPTPVLTDMPMDAPDWVVQTRGDASRIELSARYGAMTPSQVDAAMAHNIGGYHPGGCSALRMLAIHEVGHVIDIRRNRKPRMVVGSAVKSGKISDDLHGAAFNADGSVNPAEALATALAAVECGTATPTEHALYRILVS